MIPAAESAASHPPAPAGPPARHEARPAALENPGGLGSGDTRSQPGASPATARPNIAGDRGQAAAYPPDRLEGWRIVFEPDLSLFKTCNDPTRIFDELANLGTIEVEAHIGKVPSFGELDPTQCYLSWTLLLRSTAEHARVAEVFDWVDANSKIVYEPIYGAGVSPAGVPSLPAAEPGTQAGAQRPMTSSDVPAALRRRRRVRRANPALCAWPRRRSMRSSTSSANWSSRNPCWVDLPKDTSRRTSNRCAEVWPSSRVIRASCRKAFCRFACCPLASRSIAFRAWCMTCRESWGRRSTSS